VNASDRLERTLIWVNTPSNPTGRVHSKEEIEAVLDFISDSDAIVAVDECYLSFGDSKTPISTLQTAAGQNRNLLVAHSLSKRSNLAGYRGAFLAGDKDLIARLLEVRKHAGMMAPLPIQHATAVALGDEEHVKVQAERYRLRRTKLVPALAAKGYLTEFSEAGLYIWCSDGRSDWEQVEWFATRGITVTPGNFYGKDGVRHIRIALTASDERIDEVIARISRD
jgi:aspartate/methionine/tyrosine aminotransferase